MRALRLRRLFHSWPRTHYAKAWAWATPSHLSRSVAGACSCKSIHVVLGPQFFFGSNPYRLVPSRWSVMTSGSRYQTLMSDRTRIFPLETRVASPQLNPHMYTETWTPHAYRITACMSLSKTRIRCLASAVATEVR